MRIRLSHWQVREGNSVMCLHVKVVELSADETQTFGNRPVSTNIRLSLEIEKYDWPFPHNFIAELGLEKALSVYN